MEELPPFLVENEPPMLQGAGPLWVAVLRRAPGLRKQPSLSGWGQVSRGL